MNVKRRTYNFELRSGKQLDWKLRNSPIMNRLQWFYKEKYEFLKLKINLIDSHTANVSNLNGLGYLKSNNQ